MPDKFGIPAIPPPHQILAETHLLYNVLVEMRAQLIRHINALHAKTDALPLADLQDINTDRILGRDTPGVGPVEQLTVGGGLGFTGTGGIEIANNGVSNTKLRDSAAASVIGRAPATVGDPADIVSTAARQVLGRITTTLLWVGLDVQLRIADIQFNGRILGGNALASPPTLAHFDATVANGTSPDGWFAGLVCLDNNVTWGAFSFAVPDEFDDTISDIHIRVVFIVNAAPNSDVHLTVRWSAIKDGDSATAPPTTGVANKITTIDGYGAGDYVVTEFDEVISGASVGGHARVKGVIERDATAGNGFDTYGDLIAIVQIMFFGVRKLFA